MTLPWIIGGAAAGVLAGPPLRACALARYSVKSPRLTVEAAAGVALAVAVVRSASAWQAAALCWLMLCAVALTFIDFAVRRLPDPLTGAAFVGVLSVYGAAVLAGGHPGQLVRAAVAAGALGGFYLLLFLIRPSGMGLGDLLTELRLRSPQTADVTGGP